MLEQSTCGCCNGIEMQTPQIVNNQPGLKSIAYRIGKHHHFKASLLSKLTSRQLKSLLKLTTRANDDFTIALLDSFAVMADVLTFYQERIANEAYLNTAEELLSVTELARLIGYQPNPGVAATTYLSFTLDDNSTQPGEDAVRKIKSTGNVNPIIELPTGTISQSIPEQGEDPQIFETVEEIYAKSDWNAMKVKSFVEQDDLANTSVIYIKGIENNISNGDQILIITEDSTKMKKIVKVDLLKDIDTTAIYFNTEPLFTIFITNLVVLPLLNYYVAPYSLTTNTIDSIISEPASSNDLNSAIAVQSWDRFEFNHSINTYKAPSSNQSEVFVFRKNASLFGYNAPLKITNIAENGDVTTDEHDLDESPGEITLDAEYPEVTSGDDSYIALKRGSGSFQYYKVNSAELLPQSKYGMNAKSTKINVDGLTWTDKMSQVRNSMAYIQSEQLALAQKPITEPLEKGTSTITLNKFYVDLRVGQRILVSGEIVELPGIIRAEVHTIRDITMIDGLSQITIEHNLENRFIRDTITVNANVALATHGETVHEILGSGNSAQAFQKFKLKQKPLTYVGDDSTSGSSSTIQITVNDILWSEVPFLYGQAHNAQVYTITHGSDETATITFGDGKFGARLPTGNQNIRATYRRGIGASGMLKSNQITQLLSKPHHLKTVNNPLAPEGAQDAEQIENARKNATLTIFTLDRIVSLKDYEDFARAFAGIEKAKAVWLWSNSGKIVHLTIAGSNGSEIAENSELRMKLISAMNKKSHLGVSVEIDSYIRKFFQIKGSLKVFENYNFDIVHQQVADLLREQYSFENRDIGEHIYLSKIIAEIESIEGVQYVDIDQLFITGLPQTINHRLSAQVLKSNSTEFRASELIELDPNPIQFQQL